MIHENYTQPYHFLFIVDTFVIRKMILISTWNWNAKWNFRPLFGPSFRPPINFYVRTFSDIFIAEHIIITFLYILDINSCTIIQLNSYN